MEIGEYFVVMTFSVVDHFFHKKKKTPHCFETKPLWVGAGSGVGLGLVSTTAVLFRAFFVVFQFITLEPHAGHTKLPDFSTLS